MQCKSRAWPILLVTVLLLSGCATPPPNLYFQKQALIRYHDSGPYSFEVHAIAARALKYIRHRSTSGETNLAVVLDIDDTAISSWDRLMTNDFARKDELFIQWANTHLDPPIVPVLELYRATRQLG